MKKSIKIIAAIIAIIFAFEQIAYPAPHSTLRPVSCMVEMRDGFFEEAIQQLKIPRAGVEKIGSNAAALQDFLHRHILGAENRDAIITQLLNRRPSNIDSTIIAGNFDGNILHRVLLFELFCRKGVFIYRDAEQHSTEAIECLTMATLLMPEQASARLYLGKAWYKTAQQQRESEEPARNAEALENYKRALEHINEAIKLDKGSADAVLWKAITLRWFGHYLEIAELREGASALYEEADRQAKHALDLYEKAEGKFGYTAGGVGKRKWPGKWHKELKTDILIFRGRLSIVHSGIGISQPRERLLLDATEHFQAALEFQTALEFPEANSGDDGPDWPSRYEAYKGRIETCYRFLVKVFWRLRDYGKVDYYYGRFLNHAAEKGLSGTTETREFIERARNSLPKEIPLRIAELRQEGGHEADIASLESLLGRIRQPLPAEPVAVAGENICHIWPDVGGLEPVVGLSSIARRPRRLLREGTTSGGGPDSEMTDEPGEAQARADEILEEARQEAEALIAAEKKTSSSGSEEGTTIIDLLEMHRALRQRKIHDLPEEAEKKLEQKLINRFYRKRDRIIGLLANRIAERIRLAAEGRIGELGRLSWKEVFVYLTEFALKKAKQKAEDAIEQGEEGFAAFVTACNEITAPDLYDGLLVEKQRKYDEIAYSALSELDKAGQEAFAGHPIIQELREAERNPKKLFVVKVISVDRPNRCYEVDYNGIRTKVPFAEGPSKEYCAAGKEFLAILTSCQWNGIIPKLEFSIRRAEGMMPLELKEAIAEGSVATVRITRIATTTHDGKTVACGFHAQWASPTGYWIEHFIPPLLIPKWMLDRGLENFKDREVKAIPHYRINYRTREQELTYDIAAAERAEEKCNMYLWEQLEGAAETEEILRFKIIAPARRGRNNAIAGLWVTYKGTIICFVPGGETEIAFFYKLSEDEIEAFISREVDGIVLSTEKKGGRRPAVAILPGQLAPQEPASGTVAQISERMRQREDEVGDEASVNNGTIQTLSGTEGARQREKSLHSIGQAA